MRARHAGRRPRAVGVGRAAGGRRGPLPYAEWLAVRAVAPTERAEPTAPPPGLLDALGVATAQWVGRNRLDHVVVLASEEEVRTLTPEIRRLGAIPGRGVIVTARAARGPFDFVSRFFAPTEPVPEDPVTGSAHCCLGVLWAEHLGRDRLVAFQASPRGGVVPRISAHLLIG